MFLWAYCLRTKEHSDLRFVVVNFDFMKAQKHFGDNQIYHQQWVIHLACESRRIFRSLLLSMRRKYEANRSEA